MKVVWTKHAEDRQREWEKKLSVTKQRVEDLLILERRAIVRIKYDSEADVLMLILQDAPPVNAIEEPGGIIVSYGENGEPVSVEFLNASSRHLVHAGEMSITLQAK